MFEQKTVNHLPQSQRLDSFRDLVSDIFFPMAVEPYSRGEGRFSADIQLTELQRVSLASIVSSPLDVYRRRTDISRATEAAYLVKVQVSGEGLVKQRGREAHLLPGDFAICLSSEPYELHFEQDYSQLVLAVPQTLMEECVRHPEQHLGMRMDSKVGANGLFSQFVTMIGARLNDLDGVLAQRLEANVIDLLSTTLSHAQETQKHDLLACGVKSEYLMRIKSFIRTHLTDESLTPDYIARSHNISTRYLHMLFADEGESVSRYIQRLRLEACGAALKDPAFASYSASEIAYHYGFNDASHFSRVFKALFGETPARYRKS
jgi:AraC family transcriptional activator of tynA and feaB